MSLGELLALAAAAIGGVVVYQLVTKPAPVPVNPAAGIVPVSSAPFPSLVTLCTQANGQPGVLAQIGSQAGTCMPPQCPEELTGGECPAAGVRGTLIPVGPVITGMGSFNYRRRTR